MPDVQCNSPFNVTAGTGGQHTVSTSAEFGNITSFEADYMPPGVSFGDISGLGTPSATAKVTVASYVPAGTYLIEITATDGD